MCSSRLVVFIILLSLYITGKRAHSTNTADYKCCAQNEIIIEKKDSEELNTIYMCSETNFTAKQFDLLTGCGEDGQCMDELMQNDFETETEKRSVIKMKCKTQEITQKIMLQTSLRKCCPIEKTYNNTYKNCVNLAPKHNLYNYFNIQDNIHDIGLQNCNGIATEKIVNSLDEIKLSGNKLIIQNTTETINLNKLCIDETDDNKVVIKVCNTNLDWCIKNPNHVICLKKCCSDGYSLVRSQLFQKSICQPTFKHGFDITIPGFKNVSGDFAILYAESCFKYIPQSNEYYIDKEGILHLEELGRYVTRNPLEKGYCMDFMEGRKDNKNGYYILLCAFEPNYTVKVAGMCLSIVCLFLTIIGYGCLPDLRNLFGKTLICYCSSLLVATTCLVVVILSNFSRIDCRPLGYLTLFTFTAAFAWLTVMCFDIWYHFSTIRLRSRNKDLRKFIFYNIFAWSSSVIVTVVILILNFYELLPEEYSPIMNAQTCFLDRATSLKGDLIFFRTPIAIMIIINIYFFITTIYYCIKVKNEINKMKDNAKKKSFIVDKERMMLCLKLFIIMGLLWIMEVLTAFVHFRSNVYLAMIENIFDVLNSLQGVYIFLIYMCKKSIYQNIKKKLGVISKTVSVDTNITEMSNTSKDGIKETSIEAK